MTRVVLALLVGVSALGACSSPSLDAQGAAESAIEAFAAAGLAVTDATGMTRETVDLAVADGSTRSDDVWLMSLTVDGEAWTVGVDPDSGAVVRTFEPAGSDLDDAQVQALLDHRHNPDASRTAQRRRRAAVGVSVVVMAGGYVVLRTLARRSAASPPIADLDSEI